VHLKAPKLPRSSEKSVPIKLAAIASQACTTPALNLTAAASIWQLEGVGVHVLKRLMVQLNRNSNGAIVNIRLQNMNNSITRQRQLL
jgi:hypothetical protein